MEFLVKSAGSKYNPSQSKIAEIVGLFGDLASAMPELKALLQHDLVGAIISQAKQSQDSEVLQTANWAEQ